jgi:hypothetical protein
MPYVEKRALLQALAIYALYLTWMHACHLDGSLPAAGADLALALNLLIACVVLADLMVSILTFRSYLRGF